ncbi:hypothetical protein [Roseinatronobacter sp.]|uniref:hypothetical protein n=1 Tax=Roseinatronobacter sp. TaxID=1945755 RepID=UPI0025DCF549|nr:hypothetical protein [Rhodobaca sp.]
MDLASIKRYRLNLGSPHRGPTLRGYVLSSTLRKALKPVIGDRLQIGGSYGLALA